MNILIVGSEGFIGRHLVSHFSKRDNQVFSADIVASANPKHFLLDATDPNFENLFSNQQFEVCINASGSAHVQFSFEHPEVDFALNVTNVQRMLEAIRRQQPSCRFMNFSSAAVYGNPESMPVKESSPLHPMSPYGWHKLMSEQLCHSYHETFAVPTLSLRIFSAYGQGLKKQLFWDLYHKAAAATNEVTLFGTGKESRDFIHISDLVIAIELLINKVEWKGQAINVATGIETTIEKAASCLVNLCFDNKKLCFNGQSKAGDPVNWCADISVLKAAGFKPGVSIDKGLEQYASWLKNLS